jgi:hypothetical protein
MRTEPIVARLPWVTLTGTPDRPGRWARLRCLAAMAVHEIVELVVGTDRAHSMRAARRYAIGATTITVPASRRNNLYLTTVGDFPSIYGDLVYGRVVELRVYQSGTVDSTYEQIINAGPLVEVRLSNPVTNEWELISGTTATASVILWTPSLTPTIGDDIHAVQWSPGSANPLPANSNYAIQQTWSWTGTWPGENDDRVLLLVDADYWPTVYARATASGFVQLPLLGGTPIAVSCATLGGLHATTYVGLNFDNDLTGGTSLTDPAAYFLPIAVAADHVSIPENYTNGLSGAYNAHDAFDVLDDIGGIPAVTSEPHGFPNRTDSTIAFDNGDREFSIAPTGSEFHVWCSGVRYTIDTTQTVTIPNTSGLYYIHYTAGSLGYSTTYFDWPTEAPVAYIYWNATAGAAQFFADERHGITLDWATHEYLHRTRGAALANGFNLGSYTTVGDGTSNGDAQVALTDGTFFDEDLQVDIINDPTPTANTWEQRLSTVLYAPVFYRSGTVWTRDTATAYPLKFSTRATYNLNTAGTWSTPAVGNNKYVSSWVVATNNLTEPVIVILDQSEHSNAQGALAVTFDSLDLSDLPIFEMRPLWKLVFQTANSYSNAVKSRLVAVQDIRGQLPVSAGVSAGDHGSLSGLLDDDHPIYEPNDVLVDLAGSTISLTDETRVVMIAGGVVNLPDAATRAGGRHVTVYGGAATTVNAVGTDVISTPGVTSLQLLAADSYRLVPFDATAFIGTWIWFPIDRSGSSFDLPPWWNPITGTVGPNDGDLVTMAAGIPTWAAPTIASHASTHEDGGADELALDADQIATGTIDTARLATSGTASASTFLRGDQTWQSVGTSDERPWLADALAEDMARSDALWLRCHPTAASMDGTYDGTWQITNGSTGTGTLPATPDGIDIRAKFYLHQPYSDDELGPGQAWPYQIFRELITQTKATATGGDLTEWAVLHSDSSFVDQITDGAAMWFYESTLTGDPGEGPAYNYDDGSRLIGVPVIARLTHDTATETVTFWRWVPYDTGVAGVEQTADGYWWQPIDSRTDAQYASMDPNGVETWKLGIQNRVDFAWITMHEFGGSLILDVQPSDLATAGAGATSFTDGVGNTIATTTGTIGYGGGDDERDVDAARLTGTVDPARLGTGTPTSSTYLRGDQTWQAVAGATERPPSLIVAGSYVATSFNSTGNSGVTSNRLFYLPIYVTRTTSFDRIGINHAATTAGAGSIVRLGIYNSTNDLPSTLVLDAGFVDLTTAAAYKEVTISPSQSLGVGVYWLAAVAQVTSGSPTFVTGTPIMPVPSSLSTFNGAKFEAGVSGALPATATIVGTANATQPPVIFLRAVP